MRSALIRQGFISPGFSMMMQSVNGESRSILTSPIVIVERRHSHSDKSRPYRNKLMSKKILMTPFPPRKSQFWRCVPSYEDFIAGGIEAADLIGHRKIKN